MKSIYVLFVSLLLIGSTYAECMVNYSREACDGMHRSGRSNEEISFAKCGGTKTCTKQKGAASKEACVKIALKSCGNKRYTITKSKVITATWNGEEIVSPTGNKDFCIDYAKRAQEYNKCLN